MFEIEYDNEMSLVLYDKLGFLREKWLYWFYFNEKDVWVFEFVFYWVRDW